MVEEKWTKGPWAVEREIHDRLVAGDHKQDLGDLIIYPSDDEDCIIGTVNPYIENGYANARLMTAAPELYGQHEADITDISLLLSAINNDDPPEELVVRCRDILRRKKAVMAKARGEDSDG